MNSVWGYYRVCLLSHSVEQVSNVWQDDKSVRYISFTFVLNITLSSFYFILCGLLFYLAALGLSMKVKIMVSGQRVIIIGVRKTGEDAADVT